MSANTVVKISRLVCFLFVFTLLATPLAGANPAEPQNHRFLAAMDDDRSVTYGRFAIYTRQGAQWRKAGSVEFGKYLETKTFDLSGMAPAGESVAVLIGKLGGGAAYIDSITLGGSSPESVNGNGSSVDVAKVSAKDLDVIDAHKGEVEFVFTPGGGGLELGLTARIEPKEVSEEPVFLPLENLGRPMDESAAFFNYKMDSSWGALSMTGDPGEVSGNEPFMNQFTFAGSGHPHGPTYAWIRNDGEFLYVAIEITPGNTNDPDKDYARVYTRTSGGVKKFEIPKFGSQWGYGHFLYTDKVEYQHDYYEFKIPFSEIGAGEGEENIGIAFAVYGTVAPALVSPPNGTTYNFGPILTGETVTRNLWLYANPGPLNVTGVDLEDGSGFFSVSGGTCGEVPFAIAGGVTCSLSVTWAPSASGRFTAKLIIKEAKTLTLFLVGDSEPRAEQTLSVDFTGNGRGWIFSTSDGSLDCNGDCSRTYPQGTIVTLGAHAEPGMEFMGWGGACGGVWRGNECAVELNSDATVEAEFHDPAPNDGGCMGENSLIKPANNSQLSGTSVDFEWQTCSGTARAAASHVESGDSYTYDLYYCVNEDFSGCEPVRVSSILTGESYFAMMGAKGAAGMAGLAIFAIAFTGSVRTRRGRAILLTAALGFTLGMAACSNSSSSGTSGTVLAGTMTFSVTGLQPNTIYWWKIIASAASGTASESPVYAFTTGN